MATSGSRGIAAAGTTQTIEVCGFFAICWRLGTILMGVACYGTRKYNVTRKLTSYLMYLLYSRGPGPSRKPTPYSASIRIKNVLFAEDRARQRALTSKRVRGMLCENRTSGLQGSTST